MKKIITYLLFFILSLQLRAQIIETYAGTGVTGFYGDGGPCINAAFYAPAGICLAKDGGILVCDNRNCRIRKILHDTITTICGNYTCVDGGEGGPAANASISRPTSITTDAVGNIYLIVNGSTNTIKRIDTSGIITTIAGKYPTYYHSNLCDADSAQFATLMGLAVDSKGNIYFAESYDERVLMIDTAGMVHLIYNTYFPTFPYSFYVNASDELFFFDNNCIKKRDTLGSITTIAGTGSASFHGDGGPAVNASFKYPGLITGDSDGNLYVGDAANYRVRKIGTDGIINTIIGTGTDGFSGDGADPLLAEIGILEGMLVMPDGSLYMADNNRIRRVGNFTTAIVEGKESYVSCWPNPATGFIQLDHLSQQSTICIQDVSGKCLRQLETKLSSVVLDVHSYKPGIYFVSVVDGNNFTNFKLVIQ